MQKMKPADSLNSIVREGERFGFQRTKVSRRIFA